MLTLTLTKTNDISETDLIPGSKWRRKSDGAKCVLCVGFYGSDFLMFCNGVPLRNNVTYHQRTREMLTWLRRDFERAGGRRRDIKRLRDIDQTHLFAHEKKVWRLTGKSSYVGDWEAVRIDGCNVLIHLDPDQQVRDLGPIHIDPSVTGGGE